MSWSVSAIGRASAVAAKLAAEFTNYKCMEPEETVKGNVAAAVAAALAAFPPNQVVRVQAGGSQSSLASTDGPVRAINNLNVAIEPVYGFVE